jgi:putative membrane protein
MMWDGHEGMGWWMAGASILWVLFILAVVFLAARLAAPRDGATGHTAPEQFPRPLEIARRRYAAGEISRDEFERIRRDLN